MQLSVNPQQNLYIYMDMRVFPTQVYGMVQHLSVPVSIFFSPPPSPPHPSFPNPSAPHPSSPPPSSPPPSSPPTPPHLLLLLHILYLLLLHILYLLLLHIPYLLLLHILYLLLLHILYLLLLHIPYLLLLHILYLLLLLVLVLADSLTGNILHCIAKLFAVVFALSKIGPYPLPNAVKVVVCVDEV